MQSRKATPAIICGLPGVGKTTLAKQLVQDMPAVRFCPDEWMEDLGVTLWDSRSRDVLEKRFIALAKELLVQGQSVVLEYGFWQRKERDALLRMGKSAGARVELHYLDAPSDEIRRRLEKRQMEGDDLIIAEKLDEWIKQFERPDEQEQLLYDNE